MKKFTYLFMFAFAFVAVALGQETASQVVPEVPPVDLGVAIVGLIEAFKAGAGPAAVLLAFVQLMKTAFFGGLLSKLHKGLVPLLVLLLGGVSGIIMNIDGGLSTMDAVIQGLFNGGLAIGLYDVIVKHFVKKTEPTA